MSILERALAEAVLLGAACGPLGLWLLAYRQAYAAESVAHAMLPGLALAAAAGAPLLLGATGGVLAAALLIAVASRDRRIGSELATAVTITALFGAGVVVAAGAADGPRLTDLLFGDLLGVTTGDLVAAGVLALATGIALAAGHRPLTAAAHDRQAAPALGVRPVRVETALLALLGVALVVAVQGLGNLLVVALLIAPAVAAQRLAHRLPAQLAAAAVTGAASGALGVLVSDRLSLAAGASVALAACVLALVALVLRPGPGAALRRSPIEALAGRG
jgi:ABC-type Mn2+/Zn2+ transport system permease subunit